MKKQMLAVNFGWLILLAVPAAGQQASFALRGALSLNLGQAIVDHLESYDAVGIASVGQQWQLGLGGADPNTTFTVCGSKDSNPSVCIPNAGNTDQYGNWTLSGTFDATAVGEWVEWIQFPSGATSNRIIFTVGSVSTASISLSINNIQLGIFQAGQAWTLSMNDLTGHAKQSFDFCAEWEGESAGCISNFGTLDNSGTWMMKGVFPATALGGWSEWIKFRDGTVTNRVAFTVDSGQLDNDTCQNGTLYPIGPNAGYASFTRYMENWYPSKSSDYQVSPIHQGGSGNTLEYFGCQGDQSVWVQWAYGVLYRVEVQAPWSGATDRGFRLGNSLALFQSLYPAAIHSMASTTATDAWETGPLQVFFQNGLAVGILVDWTKSEFMITDFSQSLMPIASNPPWFVF